MITSRINIRASAEKIWKALTDKNQMKEWYFDIPDFELKIGHTFNFYEPGGKNEYHHRCEVLEIIPFKKFSHSWTHPSHSKGTSIVTWELNEQGNGFTEVVLTHTGIETFADAGPAFAPENYQMGWDGFMSILKNFVYGIRKQTYEIDINASAQKVWEALFNDETYRQWTSVFSEGSYFTGDLKPNGRIHFLTPEGHGMYSNVVFCSVNKDILFQHIGEVSNFKEQPVEEVVEKWTGAFERYSLQETSGITRLTVEVDSTPDHAAFMNEKFPQGLEILKVLGEK